MSFGARTMHRAYLAGPVSRFGPQVALDVLAWAVALLLAALLRYDFDFSRVAWVSKLILCVVAGLLQFLVGWIFFLYRGRHPYGSFAEVRTLLWVVLSVGALLTLAVFAVGPLVQIPRSTVFIAIPFALVMMASARYVKRLLLERAMGPVDGAARTVLFGAGYLGATMVRRMATDTNSEFKPVALLDDDATKRHLWHHGVPVRGRLSDLSAVVERTRASVLVVCIAQADSELMQRVQDAAAGLDLRILVLPPLTGILASRSRPADLRDISIEDLIGRNPVDTEVESVASYLTGRRVLVTGAGGSIGSELCRQIAGFDPAELIALDRDETGLQAVQLSIAGHGLLDTRDVVLADIRDADALREIFEERRPEVVFHAAALKHLPMLEQYPVEAWKTNVLGTLNVLEAARATGVDTFVNISTDKAANPSSVLGHSKRVAEKLTAWAARESGQRYVSVRFGNVIGSRGSMLPTFTSLIEAGGPLTVTHPDVTRFFMTIPEACQLVVQAGGIARPAEVLILDMGEPVKILDVAKRMIELSGKEIEITFTGLRQGEKLHEVLTGNGESNERPFHPKISHSSVDHLAPENIDYDVWYERCTSERLLDIGRVVADSSSAH